MLLPRLTPPALTVPASSLTLAALLESRIVKLSLPPPLKKRTLTDAALLPLQPERIVPGRIGSL